MQRRRISGEKVNSDFCGTLHSRKKITDHAIALKLLDPSITLILCGKNGHSDWDRYVLQEAIQWIDMHSIHMYTYGTE